MILAAVFIVGAGVVCFIIVAWIRSLGKLRASELRSRVLARATHDVTWDRNLTTNTTNWSSGVERLFGCTRKEAASLSWWEEHIHPHDRERVLASFRRAIRIGQDWECEYRFRRQDGSYLHLMDRGYVAAYEHGATRRMIGAILDVTRQRKAEAQLHRSRDELQFLTEASDVLAGSLNYEATLSRIAWLTVPRVADWCAIDLVDRDGNPRRVALAHVNPEKIHLAEEFKKKFPSDPREPFGIHHVVRTGKPERVTHITDDMLVKTARSEEHLAMLRALQLQSSMMVPLKDDGRVLGVITFVASVESNHHFTGQDLKLAQELARRAALAIERARLFQELHTSEAHFRLLVNNIGDSAIITLDPQGMITSWNSGAERIEGYAADTVMGRHVSIFHQPDDIKRGFPQEILRHAAKEGKYEWEGWCVRKDATRYWAAVSIIAIRDQRGDITGFVRVTRDRTERKLEEEAITFRANHDLLTGLPNRALMEQEIETRIETRAPSSFAVLFVDLDRFKAINDTLGHRVGDLLLRAVAERLNHAIRAGDIIARFGGDEFIVFSNVASDDEAIAVATQLLTTLHHDFVIEKRRLNISASIGIARYPEHGRNVTALFQNADAALYRAKESGRRRAQMYSEHVSREAHRRMAMESGLRQAIRDGGLELYYQPIVDVRSGAVVSAEALVRWNHPEFGLLKPLEFIALAEETGVIFPLGDWVLAAACRQLKRWHARGFRELKMSVNFSPHQLARRRVVEKIRTVLADTQLAPRAVDLEFTEGAAILNAEPITAILKELRALGVGLVLDDFGLGHSSLGYLKRFSISGIKIDQTFVRRGLVLEEDAAIIKAIILLARTLNLEFVAEGVETESERKFLEEHGCRYMQGYYFSKPLPATEFEQLLRRKFSFAYQA